MAPVTGSVSAERSVRSRGTSYPRSQHARTASRPGYHLPVDAADLNRAVEAILRELDTRWGVEAAWLFGSQVRSARPDSDIDLAVLFRSLPDPLDLLESRADLERQAGAPVDVVDLYRASPIIAFQALKTGRLVADHAPRRRIDFATHLPSRYEDLMIMRRGIERAMMRRLNHGRT